jgi:capsid protein
MNIFKPSTWFASRTIPAPESKKETRVIKSVRVINLSGNIVAASASLPFSWSGMADMNSVLRAKRADVTRRCRDMYWNNPHGSGIVKLLCALVVQNGLTPRCQILESDLIPADLASEIRFAVADLVRLASRFGAFDAVAGRKRSLYSLQRDWYLAAMVDGDHFVHRVIGVNPAAPLECAFEDIDSERIATPADKYADETVIDGIQFADKFHSRITGYWVRKPGTLGMKSEEFNLVPARDMAHFSTRRVAGQLRGLPVLTPIAVAAETDVRFMEALQEMTRQMAANQAVIEVAADAPLGSQGYHYSLPGMTEAGTSKTNYFAEKLPGDRETLDPGQRLRFINEFLPTPDLPGFRDAIVQYFSTALNLPKVMLDRDLKSVSYSGGKFAWQFADPEIRAHRDLFVDQFSTVWSWIIEAAAVAEPELFAGYNYSTKYQYEQFRVRGGIEPAINPVQTAEATAREIAMGLKSWSAASDERDRDFEETLEERADDLELADEVAARHPGLTRADLLPPANVIPSAPPQESAPQDAPVEKSPVKKQNQKALNGSEWLESLGIKLSDKNA